MPRDEQGSHDESNEKSSGDAASKDSENATRSKRPLIIVSIVVLAIGIVGFLFWFAHRNQVSTDDAYTDGNTVSVVPKVSGYLANLSVDDNSHVRKGDVLLRIDARDFLTAQAQARAQLSLAQAQLMSAKDTLRIAHVQFPAQLEAAKAQQQAAAASLAQAQSSFERQHQVDERATTQETIDASTAQQQSSLAGLRSAKAQVAIAELVPEQVRQAGRQ